MTDIELDAMAKRLEEMAKKFVETITRGIENQNNPREVLNQSNNEQATRVLVAAIEENTSAVQTLTAMMLSNGGA